MIFMFERVNKKPDKMMLNGDFNDFMILWLNNLMRTNARAHTHSHTQSNTHTHTICKDTI